MPTSSLIPRRPPRAERVAIALVGLVLTAACGTAMGPGPNPPAPPPPIPPRTGALTTETIATGLAAPLYLTAPDGDARLFVVEKPGRIRVLDPQGNLVRTPFLDITDRVGIGGERGLLGLAFHPDYASNGHFFVNYTASDGSTRVERFSVTADPDIADPASSQRLLEVAQPFANHNGGQLLFGPDGMLYVFMGDGGSGGDPLGSGQNAGTLLGAILRLDPDVPAPHVPSDNPFVNDPSARDEVWAIGLRNPWRSAFDPEGGMLYVADVGQDRVEEINAVDSSRGGINYGWNIMEGPDCFGDAGCSTAGLTLPVESYTHTDGCSVTGGLVYRGERLPDLVGHYFYSDFCSGFLRSFRLESGTAVDRRDWGLSLGSVLSFGVDAEGELYVLTADGIVSRLISSN